ncbi:transposase [Sphaerisporangium corydalis]|uniref:Transposase n=1 Tax=Sphaerisporangium corydalis TaxID=1441875 RepID=A0ABV9EKW8_9ACTN|nr:transposase [Sphaerisporangium corydalis]
MARPSKYSPEFKIDAVALWRASGGKRTVRDVAADLNVNTETLRSWIYAAERAAVVAVRRCTSGGRRPSRRPGRLWWCSGHEGRSVLVGGWWWVASSGWEGLGSHDTVQRVGQLKPVPFLTPVPGRARHRWLGEDSVEGTGQSPYRAPVSPYRTPPFRRLI